jgi:thiamine biosynthesis lipoprotein
MKRSKGTIAFLVCCLMVLLLSGCTTGRLVQKSDYTYLLGTIVKVTIYTTEKEAEEHFVNMFQLVSDLENLFSKNIDTSDVSKINEMAGKGRIQVDPLTIDLLKRGMDYSEMSNGDFDITIGPLVELWDIGGTNPKVPTQEEIEGILPKIDYNRLMIYEESQEVELLDGNMILDLGAIAKGYIADKLILYMKENNLEYGIINLGGNIVTLGGKPEGAPWRIGLQNPTEERGKELGVITCKDLSIVTSGIYERYIEEEGVRYHHILNPETGFPFENNIASVSILSRESVDGDGYSTMIFALGLIKGFEAIENAEDVEAIFVTKDNSVYLTSGVDGLFELTNQDFQLRDIQEIN